MAVGKGISKVAARSVAAHVGKHAAKGLVKETGKHIAKGLVKETGRQTAKSLVKETGKQAIQPGLMAQDSLLKQIFTTPMKMGARMVDFATGKTHVNIDTHTAVVGTSPTKWANEFLKNPSKISPIASDARRVGKVMLGKPFPNGPDIGIQLVKRHEVKTAGGLAQTVLDLKYSGAFEGPGRITITQKAKGLLDVRDEWLQLANHSILPTAAAETGHPVIAGLGFKGIGQVAQGQAGLTLGEVAESLASVPFKLMKLPFSFLPF